MKSVKIRSFFLVRIQPEYRKIFQYAALIQQNTGQKKLRIWTLFTQCATREFELVTRGFELVTRFDGCGEYTLIVQIYALLDD